MTLVFTNGVFDLLHVGHVRLLQFARAQGDRLVVAINSDASARRLKGPHRPIVPAHERAELLRALRCVDDVHIFADDTPELLIQRLRPHVLVKGPACRGTDIPGAAIVESIGGRVVIPDWPVEHSSTWTIDRIRQGADTLPRPMLQTLTIDGVNVMPSPRFSLTWVSAEAGPRPVLYDRGRRVTDAWSVHLDHEQPPDPWGRSA
ncbi:MAG: hypothetical protein KatS3mg105_4980 [Gemmatales bacterium]|nr:MAG: hypothetical protein KatS3mg105_4980 [Gemmatales bacterium]